MSAIEDAERVFSGTQSLYNWCQDLDMELWNAGLEDTRFFLGRGWNFAVSSNRRVSGICMGIY